jgi:HK97 family phage major capsid protein
MTLAQLESDLRAVTAKAEDLIKRYTAKADAENRVLSAEEKAEIDAALASGKDLSARIDAKRGDQELLAQVAALRPTGTGATQENATSTALMRPTPRQTIGQQFLGDSAVRQFLQDGGHRRARTWSSPTVECVSPLRMLGTTLTEDPASGGKLIVPDYQPGIQALLFRRLVVADLMASGTTGSNAIIYMIETTYTIAAAPVAEGSAKPESALIFDQRTDPVSKIAHWIPVTEELLEDVPAIQAYIDSRLELGVQLAEEDQLLNGNGTPPNIMGVMNRTGLATPVARNSGATPPESNAEAILRQITAIATSAFVYPTGVVMNPTNWFATVTAKDSQGRYFGDGPFMTLPTAQVWGTPVVVTPSIALGTALVGAFGSMSQVFRKGGIRIEASNSHQDYFIKNLVAIRAEERLALAVYRPGAFGKVTGLL